MVALRASLPVAIARWSDEESCEAPALDGSPRQCGDDVRAVVADLSARRGAGDGLFARSRRAHQAYGGGRRRGARRRHPGDDERSQPHRRADRRDQGLQRRRRRRRRLERRARSHHHRHQRSEQRAASPRCGQLHRVDQQHVRRHHRHADVELQRLHPFDGATGPEHRLLRAARQFAVDGAAADGGRHQPDAKPHVDTRRLRARLPSGANAQLRHGGQPLLEPEQSGAILPQREHRRLHPDG